jgi:hypothetical protein
MKRLIATLLFIFWPGLVLSPAQRSVFFGLNTRAAGGSCADGPTTNMIGRFDASSITLCSGAVGIWTSGFGAAIVATGVNGPTCVANVFGSSNGVLLASASSQSFSLSSNGYAYGSGMTIMVVFKPVTTSAKQTFTGGDSENGGSVFAYWMFNGGTTQGLDSSGTAQLGAGTATITAGNIYQTNVSMIGTGPPTFRFNKAVDATVGGSTGTISNNIRTLGASSLGDGSEFVDGYIGAIYLFSPALTTADIQTWEATLSCRYPGA